MTGEIVRDIDESATLAHENREALVRIRLESGKLGFALARLLKENRDKSYYKLLGYDSFEEFLADPDISMRRSTVYNYIRIYELFVERLKLDEAMLAEIGTRRLQLVSPVVENDPKEWMSKARELSRSDLAEEVRIAKGEGGGENKLAPPNIPPIPHAPLIPLSVYLDRLKSEPCLVCGKRPVDPAHFPRTKAAGGKPHEVIPLCRECHGKLHNEGVDSWLYDNKQKVFEWFYSKMGIGNDL